jgi:hypothetical protein
MQMPGSSNEVKYSFSESNSRGSSAVDLQVYTRLRERGFIRAPHLTCLGIVVITVLFQYIVYVDVVSKFPW